MDHLELGLPKDNYESALFTALSIIQTSEGDPEYAEFRIRRLIKERREANINPDGGAPAGQDGIAMSVTYHQGTTVEPHGKTFNEEWYQCSVCGFRWSVYRPQDACDCHDYEVK